MLNNRMGSRKIEERLGRSEPGAGYRDEPPSDEPASNGTTLFACSVVGLFVVGAAIGLATSKRSSDLKHMAWEFVMGAPPPPAYRSRVADACDKGWKDNRFNRDQIHCYMTTEVARLCDPRERHALVDKLYAYQTAMNRSDGRYNAVALGMIANPGRTLALGMADARSRDESLSEQDRAAQVEKAWAISHDIMSPMEEIERDNMNKVEKKDLVADVKSLAEQGFLADADFSASPRPKIVNEGLAAASPARGPNCF